MQWGYNWLPVSTVDIDHDNKEIVQKLIHKQKCKATTIRKL